MDRCHRCRRWLTWTEKRRQFARLMHRGFSVAEAKQILPRCQKCITVWLRSGGADDTPTDATEVPRM